MAKRVGKPIRCAIYWRKDIKQYLHGIQPNHKCYHHFHHGCMMNTISCMETQAIFRQGVDCNNKMRYYFQLHFWDEQFMKCTDTSSGGCCWWYVTSTLVQLHPSEWCPLGQWWPTSATQYVVTRSHWVTIHGECQESCSEKNRVNKSMS